MHASKQMSDVKYACVCSRHNRRHYNTTVTRYLSYESDIGMYKCYSNVDMLHIIMSQIVHVIVM